MKKLIIINGATGALGSACYAQFTRNPQNTIYCLSRSALHYKGFLKAGIMPDATLACSVGEDILKGYCRLLNKINFSIYKEVVYVHAIGKYPFEISPDGTIEVTGDDDQDGINDLVTELSHDLFLGVLSRLIKKNVRVQALIFGGLADKYKPLVHQSWWKTMEKIEVRSREVVAKNKKIGVTLLNISSVACLNELITRPFVFTDTNAKSDSWLMPHEVARKVDFLTSDNFRGFRERELYHKARYYRKGYFVNRNFTARKKRELGIQ